MANTLQWTSEVRQALGFTSPSVTCSTELFFLLKCTKYFTRKVLRLKLFARFNKGSKNYNKRIKCTLFLITHDTTKVYRGMEEHLHALTSALRHKTVNFMSRPLHSRGKTSEEQRFDSWQKQRVSYPKHPDPLWGPHTAFYAVVVRLHR